MVKGKTKVAIFIFLIPCLLFSQVNRQDRNPLFKPAIRDFSHYTFAGQIGMTVTNYGILGEGYQSCVQPSCRYKLSHQDMIAEFTDTSQIIPGTEALQNYMDMGYVYSKINFYFLIEDTFCRFYSYP